MSLEITSGPAAEPVTLQEAKAFARIADDDDDATITELIAAATEHVQQWTGRQFVQATFKLRLRDWPNGDGIIRLPRSPVDSVASVKYRDKDGDTITLVENTDFLLDVNAEPATIEPVTKWPVAGDFPDAVQVVFTAGYDPEDSSPVTDHAENVPNRAKVAIKVLTAHWFDNREPISQDGWREAPHHVTRIMQALKVWGSK